MVVTLVTSREDKVSDPKAAADLKAKLQQLQALGAKMEGANPAKDSASLGSTSEFQETSEDNVIFLKR